MKVDTLLSALATMRQQLMRVDGAHSAEQTQARLNVISTMRDYVRTNDAPGFTDYCQRCLMYSMGDLMCDILDTLYEELNMPDDTMWDEFEVQFLTADETWIEP